MHLQAIENNPLDAEQAEMFRMFEREGWSAERRLEFIADRTRSRHRVHAADPNRPLFDVEI